MIDSRKGDYEPVRASRVASRRYPGAQESDFSMSERSAGRFNKKWVGGVNPSEHGASLVLNVLWRRLAPPAGLFTLGVQTGIWWPATTLAILVVLDKVVDWVPQFRRKLKRIFK